MSALVGLPDELESLGLLGIGEVGIANATRLAHIARCPAPVPLRHSRRYLDGLLTWASRGLYLYSLILHYRFQQVHCSNFVRSA